MDMIRARSGQIERKKRNCTKTLICHGERQQESPLNFAHEQKSTHIQGVEKKLKFSWAINFSRELDCSKEKLEVYSQLSPNGHLSNNLPSGGLLPENKRTPDLRRLPL